MFVLLFYYISYLIQYDNISFGPKGRHPVLQADH
jgi:hypothetical protein